MRESDKAYNAIIDQIGTGKLRCGQAINDERLQTELKVGKTPLREALFRLTQDGYITMIPHRGMFVTTFDVAQLESLLNLRMLLSGYLSERLVQNAQESEIDKCDTKMRELICLGADMPLDEVLRADLQFHKMIGELSGDSILAGILNKLEFMSSMALTPHSKEYYLNEESVKAEYFDIFRLIRERNQAGLEAALKRHIPRYVLQHN
ncbi:MAG: GntR family transcriptional regulator [Oscillibacter sp.]|nr:GntR family transcriptional regulator [Oscillibacter sp.]